MKRSIISVVLMSTALMVAASGSAFADVRDKDQNAAQNRSLRGATKQPQDKEARKFSAATAKQANASEKQQKAAAAAVAAAAGKSARKSIQSLEKSNDCLLSQ